MVGGPMHGRTAVVDPSLDVIEWPDGTRYERIYRVATVPPWMYGGTPNVRMRQRTIDFHWMDDLDG
jgi:hypothetical protein